MLKTVILELVQRLYHATEIVNVPMRSVHALISHRRVNKENCFG